jgi:hypothetical protein
VVGQAIALRLSPCGTGFCQTQLFPEDMGLPAWAAWSSSATLMAMPNRAAKHLIDNLSFMT